MSTNSTIAILNEDGTVTGIYCHWDGYIAHNGRILAENYNDEESVRQLLELGELRYLDETLELTETYSRSGRRAQTFEDWTDLMIAIGEEYNYLFVPNEGWRVRTNCHEYKLAMVNDDFVMKNPAQAG